MPPHHQAVALGVSFKTLQVKYFHIVTGFYSTIRTFLLNLKSSKFIAVDNILLYNKLASLPENLKAEVEDFIDFLKSKAKKNKKNSKPQFGSGKGMFLMKSDFDQPLDDFKEYMS